jgi:hypothetical protein
LPVPQRNIVEFTVSIASNRELKARPGQIDGHDPTCLDADRSRPWKPGDQVASDGDCRAFIAFFDEWVAA